MDAERQVTVLFTDMVGFTSFSERSGEEVAYTLMRSLSKLMDDAVRVEPTGPSVYRTVDREHPTLIIDEADDLF